MKVIKKANLNFKRRKNMEKENLKLSKMEETIKIFFNILETFPKSYNWQSYLTLKNWKKLFFDFFIKKYWLKWEEVKYNKWDILRRIRMVEFFDFITKEYDIYKENTWRFIIETNFFRMVIFETKKKKLELLSFYNYK